MPLYMKMSQNINKTMRHLKFCYSYKSSTDIYTVIYIYIYNYCIYYIYNYCIYYIYNIYIYIYNYIICM